MTTIKQQPKQSPFLNISLIISNCMQNLREVKNFSFPTLIDSYRELLLSIIKSVKYPHNQLIFFKKMISFGNAASSYSVLIPLKTYHKKKEGNCSGRWWVRRILLTFIQLLLLQLLRVIWSMPTNSAFFKKPLDEFFYKFDNPGINCQ